MVNVAILGFGVVGSGVAEVLDTNGRHIEGKVDDLIRLKYILDVRDFPDSPFAGKVVHDFSVIEQDPEVSIVVETIGGAKAALDFTRRALQAGKSVITSNKELVATHGYELLQLAKEHGADFILGSDPDADRVGIMVRTKEDDFVVISGNQTGVLLLDYLIGAKRRTGKMPDKPVALKTIVTTEMARKVAEVNGLQCYDTFTGFKFLAEKKDELESSGAGKVIFSYEESYGYMLGDYVRDKDAVSASVELTEMAAWYASQGMTLYDALQALFKKYGYYGERTLNLVMPGLDGLKKMADLMAGLREQPPAEIAGVAVKQQKDYKDGSVVETATGARSQMELTGSNVLRYEMADGTSLIVRPSGTEPKVKVYILANGENKAFCDEKVAKYAAWAESLKD